MDTYPPEAWRRLGVILTRRRGRLGYGFRQRGAFAEANGLKLSAKTLTRLEKAEREHYPEDTLALAEAIYRLAPGSIRTVLAGGEPTFMDDAAEPPAGDRADATVTVLEGALSAGERFIKASDLPPDYADNMVKAWREFDLGPLIAALAEMQRRERNG